MLIGINLTLAWQLKPQLHKLAPAYAGFRNLRLPAQILALTLNPSLKLGEGL